MKLSKVIVLSLGLLTVSGMNAGWLDMLTGQQPQPQQPATTDWMSQIGGLMGQAPSANPAPLGQQPAAATSQIATNLQTIKTTIMSMLPTVQNAIATQNPSALVGLAPQVMALVPTIQSTVAAIQANPSLKATFASTINGILGAVNIPALAAQIRTLGANSNFIAKTGLNLLATSLENVPTLLQTALR